VNRATCSEACGLVVSLLIDARTARRLGIASRTVVIGRGRAQLDQAGSTKVRVRISKKVAKRLRKARRLKLSVRVQATDLAGNRRTVTRKLRVKR
jgi:hypothetical protein